LNCYKTCGDEGCCMRLDGLDFAPRRFSTTKLAERHRIPFWCDVFGTALSSCSKTRRVTSASLNHLIGTGEERGRNRKAKSLCGFEIDDQLILGRRLRRKISGLLAP
jgi:hypothetical protein